MRRSAAGKAFLAVTVFFCIVSAFALPSSAQQRQVGKRNKAAAVPRLLSALAPPPFFPPARLRPDRFSRFLAQPRPAMSRPERRAWLLLGVAQHGAAFFDARTTRDAMQHYRELDPFRRPFAHSAALYPVMQIAPAGLDWLAIRLATSRHRWLRRIWWLPQAAATAGFLWSGVHNLRLPAVPPR